MPILIYIIATAVHLLFLWAAALLTPFFSRTVKGVKTGDYLYPLLHLPAFLLLYFLSGGFPKVLVFTHLFSLANLLLLLAVVPLALLSCFQKGPTRPSLRYVLQGILQEIPQRLFMQNLIAVLVHRLMHSTAYGLPVVLNTLLGLQLLLIQEAASRTKPSLQTAAGAGASLGFSLCAGLLYAFSGNILLPMAAHGLKRYLSAKLRRFYYIPGPNKGRRPNH